MDRRLLGYLVIHITVSINCDASSKHNAEVVDASKYTDDPSSHESGFRRLPGAIVAPYNNAERQLALNELALKEGSGTGTGEFYGVPGTRFNGASVKFRRRYLANYKFGDVEPLGADSGWFVAKKAVDMTDNADSYMLRPYIYVPPGQEFHSGSLKILLFIVKGKFYKRSAGSTDYTHSDTEWLYVPYFYDRSRAIRGIDSSQI